MVASVSLKMKNACKRVDDMLIFSLLHYGFHSSNYELCPTSFVISLEKAESKDIKLITKPQFEEKILIFLSLSFLTQIILLQSLLTFGISDIILFKHYSYKFISCNYNISNFHKRFN